MMNFNDDGVGHNDGAGYARDEDGAGHIEDDGGAELLG